MEINNDKIRKAAEEAAMVFVKNYKLPLQDAIDFFYENIIKDEEISKLINNSSSEKQLSKSSAFKNFLKKNKKDLYYKLRKYKGSNENRDELLNSINLAKSNPTENLRKELLQQLAAFHVSSQERFLENEAFYAQLENFINTAGSIIDVGCGVQPLFFPHENFPGVKKYIALDKDRESVQLMQNFGDAFSNYYSWLLPQTWNIGEGWEKIIELHGMDSFDVALVLKVVPVVKRVDPGLLEQLMQIPARTVVISGVKESMVKKHDIEHKERRAIMQFITASGRTVKAEFELENEFFIVIE
jgi:16S rRNA (guanine(1405)-N(7))-methyltransferase